MVLVQVGETDLEDTVLEKVFGILEPLGLVDEGLSNISDFKEGGSLDVVPLFASKRINDFFLETFFTLGESFIFTNSHDDDVIITFLRIYICVCIVYYIKKKNEKRM